MSLESSSLILRVKRHRDDRPLSTIRCLIGQSEDDNNGKKKKRNHPSFAEISLNEIPTRGMVLKRIRTLECFGSDLDQQISTLSTPELPLSTTEEDFPSSMSSSVLLVPTGKGKALSSSCIVVDINQVGGGSGSRAQESTKTKVLDPATRLIDKGIKTAMQRGDFNEIALALTQGGNPDHQTAIKNDDGGFTCLMAASKHGNLRMIRRLLQLGVNSLVRNHGNCTALDLLRPMTHRNRLEIQEIASLLQQHMLKHANVLSKTMSLSTETDRDYLVDIYCIHTDQETIETETETEQKKMNTVTLSGLAMTSDGSVELLTGYDSDWSDLCDDEDPDSNDERFTGNDYPEDEDEGDDDEEDEEGNENNNNNNNNGRMRKNKKEEEDFDLEADIDIDSDDEHRKFDRQLRVGKVVRPVVMGQEDVHNNKLDSESIRELWDIDHHHQEEEDNRPPQQGQGQGQGHEDRLFHMRNRTGMLFATDAGEFDRTGIPKYGIDLSDDDNDNDEFDMQLQRFRPPRNTVAWDPDLDHSSEDDR